MTDQRGLSLAPRRISLSTSGILPKLIELGQHSQRPRLAVSLNASHQEQRERIMPITRKYRLDDLIRICREFPVKRAERILFEYVLLDGVNDSAEDARRVVELLRGIPAVVNLLPWNAALGLPFRRPPAERVHAFHEIVSAAMPCYERKTRGEDISAACGQLKLVNLEPASA
jgi:23S rRNA (adenine2503-C2)-methyltransferase